MIKYPQETTALLGERAVTHGSFADNARFGQAIRDLYRTAPAWHSMPAEHREALDRLACKLSRILSGQSLYADHWRDISGYSALAEKECK
jgi:hypothetical protein